MIITKYRHSCLLVEEGNARILIDPGAYSKGHTELTDIDAIFLTHEHPDHCHSESLFEIKRSNSNTPIYANTGAGKKLEEAGIAYELFEDGTEISVQGVSVSGHGTDHAEIYHGFPCFVNTGVLIGGRLFHPGDAVDVIPPVPVEILALPVVAPWLRLATAIDYALQMKPKTCIPIHDGFFGIPGPFHALPEKILTEAGIEFIIPVDGVLIER